MHLHKGLLALFILSGTALLAGCGSVENVKGDVAKVDRRTLPADAAGFRLKGKPSGEAVLQEMKLCPVQERHTFREVRVSKQSGLIAVPQGIGCAFVKVGEIGNLMTGSPGGAPSNCRGYSSTDRRETGKNIAGAWRTVSREPCGGARPVPAGGTLSVHFTKTRTVKTYTIGKGGSVRFSREDLARLRIYFTILRDMEIDVRYRGAKWRQKLTLE